LIYKWPTRPPLRQWFAKKPDRNRWFIRLLNC